MVWLVCAPGTPTRLKEHGEQETDPGERPNPKVQGMNLLKGVPAELYR